MWLSFAMKTFHLTPSTLESQLDDVVSELRRAGVVEPVSVTIAGEREAVSPRQAAEWLGFSRQHVMRLVDAGELEAEQLPGSRYWRSGLSASLPQGLMVPGYPAEPAIKSPSGCGSVATACCRSR